MSDNSITDIEGDAHRLIGSLPENATWEDVMDQVYVRQSSKRAWLIWQPAECWM